MQLRKMKCGSRSFRFLSFIKLAFSHTSGTPTSVAPFLKLGGICGMQFALFGLTKEVRVLLGKKRF